MRYLMLGSSLRGMSDSARLALADGHDVFAFDSERPGVPDDLERVTEAHLNASTLHHGFENSRAKIVGRCVGERSAETANSRAGCGCDYNIGHVSPPVSSHMERRSEYHLKQGHPGRLA